MSRLVISVLMVLAVVPFLLTVPPANSQSLTTITGYSTLVAPFTSTTTGMLTTFTTSYEEYTSSFTSTSYLANPILVALSDSGSLAAPGEQYGCEINYGNGFSASEGQVLSGSLTSDNPINFYLMTQSNYDVWRSINYCSVDVPTLIAERASNHVSFIFSDPSCWSIPLSL